MTYCTNCGTQLPDEARVCTQCGHPRGMPAGPVLVSPARTDGGAIAALILGIAGFVFCPLVFHVVAVIVGMQARKRIRADSALEGEGLAQAGVILGWIGWIGIGLSVAVMLFMLLGLATTMTPGL